MEEKIKKIRNWIDEQGYPLEIYCENILSKNEFYSVQSLYYEDQETKKYREIDIVATKFKSVNGVTFNFSLVIECKLSKNKPWLVFIRKPYLDLHEEISKDVFATRNGKMLLKRSEIIRKFSLMSYNEDLVGYNVTQCFTSGKDIPYQALMNTISACEYLEINSNSSDRKFCNFYFPIVVVDCELYKCCSGKDGITLNETKFERLLTMRSYSQRSNIMQTIVAKEGFEEFIIQISQELDTIFEKMLPEFEYISNNMPSNYTASIFI